MKEQLQQTIYGFYLNSNNSNSYSDKQPCIDFAKRQEEIAVLISIYKELFDSHIKKHIKKAKRTTKSRTIGIRIDYSRDSNEQKVLIQQKEEILKFNKKLTSIIETNERLKSLAISADWKNNFLRTIKCTKEAVASNHYYRAAKNQAEGNFIYNILYNTEKKLDKKRDLYHIELDQLAKKYLSQYSPYLDYANHLSAFLLNYLSPNEIKSKVYLLNFGIRTIDTERFGYDGNSRKQVDSIELSSPNKSKTEYIKRSDCYAPKGRFSVLYTLVGEHLIKTEITNESLAYFLKSSDRAYYPLSEDLLEKRSINISQEIKMVRIIQNNVIQIYTHGFTEPEVILFDSYDLAYKFLQQLQ